MESIQEFTLYEGPLESYYALEMPKEMSLEVSRNAYVLSAMALHNGSSFAVKVYAQSDPEKICTTKRVAVVKAGAVPNDVGWKFLNSFVVESGKGKTHQEEAYHAYVRIM